MNAKKLPLGAMLISLAVIACNKAPETSDGSMQNQAEEPSSVAEEPRQSSTPIKRDEFRALVLGKTPEEVISAVGKPGATAEDGYQMLFSYWDRTMNPHTGKADRYAHVHFHHGRVEKVRF